MKAKVELTENGDVVLFDVSHLGHEYVSNVKENPSMFVSRKHIEPFLCPNCMDRLYGVTHRAVKGMYPECLQSEYTTCEKGVLLSCFNFIDKRKKQE